MLRFSNKIAVTSSLLVLAAMSAMCTALPAQQPANPQPPRQPSPELWQLLSQWADGSKNVTKLHGKHQRRSYDNTFGIEKLATGEFWYEAPDKGRIDVVGVEITAKMVEARNQPDAQVQRTKDGKPYQLQTDAAQRWICDGTKVFDIDDPKKTAHVVNLPPENRGKGIMNSPLPFLFGLPPQDAVKRFDLTIHKDYRPAHKLVWIKATPRTRGDAQNWSAADVMLNTETWLPKDVKLVNPAETKSTHYAFQDMEVNQVGLIHRLLGKDPWNPKLGRDYKIHVIQPDQEQPAAAKNPQGFAAVPNVIGMPHNKATQLLLTMGIQKEQIKLQRGGPAPQPKDMYHVRDQNPKSGVPLNNVKTFTLVVYEAPVAAGAAAKPANRVPVQQVGNRVPQGRARTN